MEGGSDLVRYTVIFAIFAASAALSPTAAVATNYSCNAASMLSNAQKFFDACESGKGYASKRLAPKTIGVSPQLYPRSANEKRESGLEKRGQLKVVRWGLSIERSGAVPELPQPPGHLRHRCLRRPHTHRRRRHQLLRCGFDAIECTEVL